MSDLHKALADIGTIRQHMAAGTQFRGLGPAVMALSGVLALVAAFAQSAWHVSGLAAAQDPIAFFAVWVAVAVVCATLIGVEMRARTYRHHGGLADTMIVNAVENFVPAGAAGAALALVILQVTPECAWMLPGLWQVLVAVGLFAALRFLPRTVAFAAAWYFLAGLAVLTIGGQTRALSPWMMGLPFGIGQLLLGAILYLAFGGDDEKAR